MTSTARFGLALLTSALAALTAAGCDGESSRDAREDRQRMADDLMERMNDLEQRAADARHVVILVSAGERPSDVAAMLIEGRWRTEDETEDLADRLPLEIASKLTETEAQRLADSLRQRGATVEIALNPQSGANDPKSEGVLQESGDR